MRSLHLAIAVAVALWVQTAAYPVYETGSYRGSDWEQTYGDKEPQDYTYGGSRRWVQPETRWGGYPAYAATETKPRHEAVERAKQVVEESEEKKVKPIEEVETYSGLAETDEEDEFDLADVLFSEEMVMGPVMPPGEAPASEAAGSGVEYEFEWYLPFEIWYEPTEAPAPEVEKYFGIEYYYYYTVPAPLPAAEPYYPPAYAPYEAPVPAPEPEEVPVVIVAPPVKKAKKHKKAEHCEQKGPCPCECKETKTTCYCYPALPKRQYPSYYTPQYSPYTHYGKGHQTPYYEQEPVEPKPKKIKPPPKPEPEPEPEEVPVKPHKKPRRSVHPKPEPEPEHVPEPEYEPEPVQVVVEAKPKPKSKRPGHKKEVPAPEVTKVGVYPEYGYPHGKYQSTYPHYYYGPQEEMPWHCTPPHKCESKKYPGHQYAKKPHPEYEEPVEKKKKKCKRCRKCKRCGPCVEDEHGCAHEIHDDSHVHEKL